MFFDGARRKRLVGCGDIAGRRDSNRVFTVAVVIVGISGVETAQPHNHHRQTLFYGRPQNTYNHCKSGSSKYITIFADTTENH